MTVSRAVSLSLCLLAVCAPVQAASSTTTGQISVTQVVDLIERSPGDNGARNAAMAYLAGVGEATSLLVAESGKMATGGLTCRSPLSMSSNAALAALSGTSRALWPETPATPLLVEDMLTRAGCR